MKPYIVRLSVLTILVLAAKANAVPNPYATLVWHDTLAEALQEAQDTGKKRIYAVSWNEGCGLCETTKEWYAEDPSVKPIIEEHYILWTPHHYNDTDFRSTYYSQIPPGGSLPYVFVLDVDNLATVLDSGTGTQYPNFIYDMLFPLIPVAPTFAEWIETFGLPAEEQGHDDCPGEDGVPNLLKYACDLTPTNYCATTNLMQTGSYTGAFEVVYFKSKDTVDVQLDPVWSDSLTNGTWTTTGIATGQLEDEDGREKWKVVVPASQKQGFIRLRATQ